MNEANYASLEASKRLVAAGRWIKCHCCGKKKKSVRRRRQRTAYVDDEKNWVTLCDKCAEENDAYWNERWAEYYADCM